MKLCDICIQQLEQQEEILKQLQQELNKERSRHQETSSQLHHNKKTLTTLNDDFDALQKREREAQASVSTHLIHFFCYCASWAYFKMLPQQDSWFSEHSFKCQVFQSSKCQDLLLSFLLCLVTPFKVSLPNDP